MKNAFIPFVALIHNFNQNAYVSLKFGYGFISSTDFDTIIDASSYYCNRSINDIKIDAEINYRVLNTNSFALLLSGEIGINRLIEKIDCYDDKKYNQFGYGVGVGIGIKKGVFTGLIVKYDYYRIGDNILLGLGFEIPIVSND